MIQITTHNTALLSSTADIDICQRAQNDASVALPFQNVVMVQFRAGNLESGRLFLVKAAEVYHQGGK